MASIMSFSANERYVLETVLSRRIEYELQANSSSYFSSREEASFLLSIVLNGEPIILNQKQQNLICGCINENIDHFRKAININSPSEWASLSEDQITGLELIDTCKDILTKCGFYKVNKSIGRTIGDHAYRYRETLAVIDELKKSQTIVLSQAGENNYYRITFVNDTRFIELEFHHQISLRDMSFVQLGNPKKDVFQNRKYSIITTKQQARKRLLETQNNHRDLETMKFVYNFLC